MKVSARHRRNGRDLQMSASIRFTAPPPSSAGMQVTGGGVTHCQRRLEPWLLMAVGGHIAWIALSASEAAALWPFVVVAALAAAWAWVPAFGTRPDLAMRGLLLVVGACLVHAEAAPLLGGVAGVLMFWLGILVLYYCTLLTPGWRVFLLLVALLGLLGFAPRGIGEVPSVVMAQAGLVCMLLGLAAALLGRFSEAPARVDNHTRLLSEPAMLSAGERMLERARREEEPLSIAIFSFRDLVELRSIYGKDMCSDVMRTLVRDLRRLPNSGCIAARSGPTEFTVVFPRRDLEDVEEAIDRVLGYPACFEFESGDDEIVLVPELIVRTAQNTDTFSLLHAASRAELIERQQKELLRRKQLELELARHSRPTPLTRITIAARMEPTSTASSAGPATEPAEPMAQPELRVA
jgi:GGDEF domain-containing protein